MRLTSSRIYQVKNICPLAQSRRQMFFTTYSGWSQYSIVQCCALLPVLLSCGSDSNAQSAARALLISPTNIFLKTHFVLRKFFMFHSFIMMCFKKKRGLRNFSMAEQNGLGFFVRSQFGVIDVLPILPFSKKHPSLIIDNLMYIFRHIHESFMLLGEIGHVIFVWNPKGRQVKNPTSPMDESYHWGTCKNILGFKKDILGFKKDILGYMSYVN